MPANRWPEIPKAIEKIASAWHGGQSSELYAIASTGGLTFTDRYERNNGFAYKASEMSIRWYNLAQELVEPVEANELAAEWVALCERMAEHLDEISVVAEQMVELDDY